MTTLIIAYNVIQGSTTTLRLESQAYSLTQRIRKTNPASLPHDDLLSTVSRLKTAVKTAPSAAYLSPHRSPPSLAPIADRSRRAELARLCDDEPNSPKSVLSTEPIPPRSGQTGQRLSQLRPKRQSLADPFQCKSFPIRSDMYPRSCVPSPLCVALVPANRDTPSRQNNSGRWPGSAIRRHRYGNNSPT